MFCLPQKGIPTGNECKAIYQKLFEVDGFAVEKRMRMHDLI